jgi:hypothetical protein
MNDMVNLLNKYPTVVSYTSREVLALRDCSSNEMKTANILHCILLNGDEVEL